jgi:hypothetical protein
MTEDSSKEILPDHFQEGPWTGDTCEKLKVEPTKSELVILWLFIAISIIVSAVAGYLLWAKLSFRSP